MSEPLSRSEQNRRNRLTHGLSYDPLYPVWQSLKRHEAMCDEWYYNVGIFIPDILADPGAQPSPDHFLRLKPGMGSVYRKGCVEWVYEERRPTRRAMRAAKAKIRRGELVPGTTTDLPCTCWLEDPPRVCWYPPCECPWDARWDCRCCVGIRTRLGLFDDPDPVDIA